MRDMLSPALLCHGSEGLHDPLSPSITLPHPDPFYAQITSTQAYHEIEMLALIPHYGSPLMLVT